MLVGQQHPFSATENSITALCLKRTSPYRPILKNSTRALENIFFRDAASPRGLFKTNHTKLHTFPIDLDWNIVSFTRGFGQTSYMPARNLGSELVASQWRLVGGFRWWLRSVLLPVCVTYWVAERVALRGSRTSCSTLNTYSDKMNM